MESTTEPRKKRSSRIRLVILIVILAVVGRVYMDVRRDRMDSALVEAVMLKDADRVHEQLEQGADANARLLTPGAPAPRPPIWERVIAFFRGQSKPLPPRNLKTVLMLAASSADSRIGDDLIAHGANVHTALNNGLTALLIASRSNEQLAEHLLEHGADPRVKNRDGWSPMLYAAQAGHRTMVRCLLDHGADIDDPGQDGETPIMLAAINRHDDVVRYLIDRGADLRKLGIPPPPAVVFGSRMSPAAARRPVNRALLTGTPLMFAARVGSPDLIKALWDRGLDRGVSLPAQMSVLYSAISSGRTEAAAALIDRGVPVNPPDERSASPLESAAAHGSIELVKLLLQKGARANAPSGSGSTPLHSAASSGKVEIAKLLLQRGAGIDAVASNGDTPLMRGVNSLEMAAFLIDHGADVNAHDYEGKTPLMMASRPEVMRLLLDHHADVNAQDAYGRTALWEAASTSQRDKVVLLLARGANRHLADLDGKTPLQIATKRNYRLITEAFSGPVPADPAVSARPFKR